MIQFVVNDLTKLNDYGFRHDDVCGTYNYVYLHKGGRTGALSMYVDENSHRLVLFSPSRIAVAVLCKMYKDGIMDFYEDEKEATFTMKVTEEEMKIIFDIRKDKQNAKKLTN